MTTVDYIVQSVIPAAMRLLPTKMISPEAVAEMLCVGFQESEFTHRIQVQGPARGFWQFEEGGGVLGVLDHPTTRPIIWGVLESLQYKPEPLACYIALAHNDVLAAVFARLLLWTHPHALPRRHEPTLAWQQYLDTWRPGKPHSDAWAGNFERAWSIVERIPQ